MARMKRNGWNVETMNEYCIDEKKWLYSVRNRMDTEIISKAITCFD